MRTPHPVGPTAHPPARRLVPYGYLSPTVLLILVLMVSPSSMVISYSLMDNVIAEENAVFAGLANYTPVLTDPASWALRNTLVFISVSIVAHLVLGAAFAMHAQHQDARRGTKAIFRIVYILPWLFTLAVIAVIWRLLLDPSGVVNYVLTTLASVQEGGELAGDPGIALCGGDVHQHLVRLPVLHDQPARRAAGHPERPVRGGQS